MKADELPVTYKPFLEFDKVEAEITSFIATVI